MLLRTANKWTAEESPMFLNYIHSSNGVTTAKTVQMTPELREALSR